MKKATRWNPTRAMFEFLTEFNAAQQDAGDIEYETNKVLRKFRRSYPEIRVCINNHLKDLKKLYATRTA